MHKVLKHFIEKDTHGKSSEKPPRRRGYNRVKLPSGEWAYEIAYTELNR